METPDGERGAYFFQERPARRHQLAKIRDDGLAEQGRVLRRAWERRRLPYIVEQEQYPPSAAPFVGLLPVDALQPHKVI